VQPAAARAAQGFSLIEVLLALALLGIGLSMATTLISGGERIHRGSQARIQQNALASRVLTELRLAPAPQRLPQSYVTHPSAAPGLLYRAQALPAALPAELCLVEVQVQAAAGAPVLKLRGVVPRSSLEQPPAALPAAPAGGR
jgi:prepilin-type N-terminal cleavage/methylation domain-containing protein